MCWFLTGSRLSWATCSLLLLCSPGQMWWISPSGSICHCDIICLLGISGVLAVTLAGASAFYYSRSLGVGKRQQAGMSRTRDRIYHLSHYYARLTMDILGDAETGEGNLKWLSPNMDIPFAAWLLSATRCSLPQRQPLLSQPKCKYYSLLFFFFFFCVSLAIHLGD